jgi:hypothetical protein
VAPNGAHLTGDARPQGPNGKTILAVIASPMVATGVLIFMPSPGSSNAS